MPKVEFESLCGLNFLDRLLDFLLIKAVKHRYIGIVILKYAYHRWGGNKAEEQEKYYVY